MAKTQVGDRGQRYEVWAQWGDQEMRVGWQEKSTGGLIDGLMKHPAVTKIWVMDRNRDSDEPVNTWERQTASEIKEGRARRKRAAASRKRK